MTPELPALLTPESSGLLSSGFFLEKELVLANFGRDSNGDSVFLLQDDKIYKNKQTISSKKISYQKLNSHSRNYFLLFLALKISDKKQHFQRIASKYLSIFFFSFIFRIFWPIYLKIIYWKNVSKYFQNNYDLYLFQTVMNMNMTNDDEPTLFWTCWK